MPLIDSENSPEEFYGHILFSYDQADFQCLEAERNPVNGSSIRVATCLYDYHHAGSSNQYFQSVDRSYDLSPG